MRKLARLRLFFRRLGEPFCVLFCLGTGYTIRLVRLIVNRESVYHISVQELLQSRVTNMAVSFVPCLPARKCRLVIKRLIDIRCRCSGLTGYIHLVQMFVQLLAMGDVLSILCYKG